MYIGTYIYVGECGGNIIIESFNMACIYKGFCRGTVCVRICKVCTNMFNSCIGI